MLTLSTWTTEDVASALGFLSKLVDLVEVGVFALCTICGIFFLRMVILGKNQRSLFMFAAAAVLGASSFAHGAVGYEFWVVRTGGLTDPDTGFELYDYLKTENCFTSATLGISGSMYRHGESWWGHGRLRVGTTDAMETVVFQIYKGVDGIPLLKISWDGGAEEFTGMVYRGNANTTKAYFWSFNFLGDDNVDNFNVNGQVYFFLDVSFDLFAAAGGGDGGGVWPEPEDFDHLAHEADNSIERSSNIEALRARINTFLPDITTMSAGDDGVPEITLALGYSPPSGATLSNGGLNNVKFNYSFTPGSVFDNARLIARAVFLVFFGLLFVHGLLGTVKRY